MRLTEAMCHPWCALPLRHEGACAVLTKGGEAWDGDHPPSAPPLPEPCGCEESRALRLELAALRGRLARLEGGA